jgi:murein DD-endopeptidase MepM/ murein hydrolase activator NlpD
MLVTLACAYGSTGGANVPGFEMQPLWGCVTATPVPTEQFVIGTATPVVTPAPGTPAPTGEPVYGYTTPAPTETPYIRVGAFYKGQAVQMGGIFLEMSHYEAWPHPQRENVITHAVTFRIWNELGPAQLVPLSRLLFIREIHQGSRILTGRWTADLDALGDGQRAVKDIEVTMMDQDELREYTIRFHLPPGNVREVGLATNWKSSLEGGVPIWFQIDSDPVPCDYGSSRTQILVTPVVIGYGGGGIGTGGGTGVCGMPATGTISRGFGCSVHYSGIDGQPWGCSPNAPWFHNGLDIANSAGTLIYAPIGGRVIFAGYDTAQPFCAQQPDYPNRNQWPNYGLGLHVKLSNLLGEVHVLGHLQEILVVANQDVAPGQVIGAMGSTGCSTGYHLHWTIYQDGSPINPLAWTGCGGEAN